MRKKNGFTLVELLVVIALMLSILGIAIVNLVNVSDKKKEEAWKDVISQIETAATEYFTANEYLFEGLKDGVTTGTISVGKLVEDDYLNAVTNPVTEKKVSKCAVVTVKKEDGKYISSFDDGDANVNSNKTSCDSQSLVITSDVGKSEEKPDDGNNIKPPDGEEEDDGNGTGSALLNGICLNRNGDEMNASDANGYCYQKQFQLNIELLNKKGTITSVKYCNSNGYICKVDDVYDVDDDVDVGDITNEYNTKKFIGYGTKTTDDATTVVDIYNQSGTLTRIITYYKIDHDDPIIDSFYLVSSNGDYNTADPTIYINAHDKHSGIDRYENENFDSSDGDIPAEESVTLSNSIIYNSSGEVIEDFSGETTYPIVTIYDKVGNSSSGDTSYTVYKECTKTTQTYCEGPGYHGCNWGCTSYSNGRCTSTGYRDSCIDVHYYNIDYFNENPCEPYPTCSPAPTKKSKKINAKAYKFADLKKFCSNTDTFNFNHAGDKVSGAKINKSPKGAYRRYKFKELECSCTLSNNKITVNKVNNITSSTHPDGYSYIFYKSKDACENNTVNKVKQVCTQQITTLFSAL